MKRINFLLITVLFFQLAFSKGQVDTISVFSSKMNKEVKSVVIVPENYTNKKHYPVVYLLHGFSDNYAKWLNTVPAIKTLTTDYQMIIVCPDGGYSSWYFDSPVDSTSQYETFITKDLLKYVDTHYATIPDRSSRAITGLSMGGHGALYLAIRHQDIFGAAGSMTGGVDIRPFPNNWDMAKQLGTYAEQPERWEKNTVINLLNLLTPNSLAIIIDCGTDDFFFKVNENLHQQLLYRNIPHDFITRPGGHSWPYWTNAVKYQFLFMKNYFDIAGH